VLPDGSASGTTHFPCASQIKSAGVSAGVSKLRQRRKKEMWLFICTPVETGQRSQTTICGALEHKRWGHWNHIARQKKKIMKTNIWEYDRGFRGFRRVSGGANRAMNYSLLITGLLTIGGIAMASAPGLRAEGLHVAPSSFINNSILNGAAGAPA
jgi:hypothetical protein